MVELEGSGPFGVFAQGVIRLHGGLFQGGGCDIIELGLYNVMDKSEKLFCLYNLFWRDM